MSEKLLSRQETIPAPERPTVEPGSAASHGESNPGSESQARFRASKERRAESPAIELDLMKPAQSLAIKHKIP
jgi:hypothetical protein